MSTDLFAVRVLARLARLPLAAWFGMAGIAGQAILPLLVAVSVAGAPCDPGTAGLSAIHHHAASRGSSDDHPAGGHETAHHHAHCILCPGAQSPGFATLPGVALLRHPESSAPSALGAARSVPRPEFAVAAYASRAPPSSL